MINMGLGSFVRARKAVSASRASLNGIAGHEAAMKAIKPSKRAPGIKGHGLISTFPSGTAPKAPLTSEDRLNNIANTLENTNKG